MCQDEGVSIMSELPEPNVWISAKIETPPKTTLKNNLSYDTWIKQLIKGKYLKTRRTDCYFNGKDWFTEEGDKITDHVTHWMFVKGPH